MAEANPHTAVDKVAQISNLPYRRFVIGRVPNACWRFERTHPLQNAILRYSRLKICATLSLALVQVSTVQTSAQHRTSSGTARGFEAVTRRGSG